LRQSFLQKPCQRARPGFCKTDTHWSGFGCVLAAQTITEKIREKLAGQPRRITQQNGKRPRSKATSAILPDRIQRSLSRKNRGPNDQRQGTGAAINPDPNSPLLIIGDSHTLVFHDFLAEKSGCLINLRTRQALRLI